MTRASIPPLAAGFPVATEEAWRALVDKALRGGDFERRMVSHGVDGLRIEPLYRRRADAVPVIAARGGSPWRVAARVDHPMPAEASRLALADLEGGVDTLVLVIPQTQAARGFGIASETVGELDASLAGVMLDLIAIRLEPGPAPRIDAALLAALVERRQHAPAALDIDFGLDPLGTLAAFGSLDSPWTAIARRLQDTVGELRARGFRGPFVTCDTRPYHEAGCSEAQELALALASGITYLRALTEGGALAPEAAAAALSFTVAVDADQLLGIAKLRALRRLWAEVARQSGLTPAPIRIHAETAWRMLTRRDPWVNLLRTTLAAFTAGVGGADSIAVHPFTSALGLPDGFARRLARNIQIILLEETGLARVADPAAGSGAFEGLTDELARAAWARFQDIEREGGLVASLAGGHIQARIAEVRARRLADVATRKTPLTGTSEFPDLGEAPVAVLEVSADAGRGVPRQDAGSPTSTFGDVIERLKAGAARTDVTRPITPAVTAPHLPPVRLAEPFEALRDRADAAARRDGRRPAVFLAALGPAAEHGTRTTWTKNLLAAGGIATVGGDGFDTSADVAKAFAESGTRIACMTGTDETYGVLGEATAMALKSAGASHVVMAGRPGDREGALRGAGVDAFLAAGRDVVADLADLLERLGA